MYLVTPSLPCLRQLVAGNLSAATRESGLSFVGHSWPDDVEMREGLAVHLSGCEQNPSDAMWRVYVIAGDDATAIGHAGFKGGPSRNGELEMYWCVEPSWRRRGIARAAATSLGHYAFAEETVAAITATIARNNIASQCVAAALGMQPVVRELKYGLPLWRLPRDAWQSGVAPMLVRAPSIDIVDGAEADPRGHDLDRAM